MSSAATVLACPHCGGSLTREAITCAGCGATKRVLGGGKAKPSRKMVMLVDLVAVLVGGAIGVGLRFWLFPQNAGAGDYVSAGALGAGICGFIAFKMHGSVEEVKPMVVWEKPKG